jgi:hypothetical protein
MADHHVSLFVDDQTVVSVAPTIVVIELTPFTVTATVGGGIEAV